jgi:hypothetical protein
MTRPAFANRTHRHAADVESSASMPQKAKERAFGERPLRLTQTTFPSFRLRFVVGVSVPAGKSRSVHKCP